MLAVLFIRIEANYGIVDKSNNYLVEDYTRSILKTTEKNSIIFSNKWDYFISPAYYLQFVERYHSELIIVNTQLIPFPWYRAELKMRRNLDLNTVIDTGNNNIYLTPEVYSDEVQKGLFNLFPEQRIIPDVLLFRVVNDDNYYPAPDPDFVIRIPKLENVLSKHLVNLAGSMIANRIRYELQFQKIDRAKIYFLKLLEDLPEYIIPDDVTEFFKK